MSDEVVLEVVGTGFARNDVGRRKLEIALRKASRPAVAKLLNILESTQDEALQVKCAEVLLKMHLQVSKELSEDQFKRLLADVRFNGTKALVAKGDSNDDDDEDDMPILDFENIREVD